MTHVAAVWLILRGRRAGREGGSLFVKDCQCSRSDVGLQIVVEEDPAHNIWLLRVIQVLRYVTGVKVSCNVISIFSAG